MVLAIKFLIGLSINRYNPNTYSEKAKGMAEYVYGTNKTVISLTDFENYHNVADIVKCWNYRSRLDEIQKFRFDLLLQII